MCMVVYLGSDKVLKEIQYSKENPEFYIDILNGDKNTFWHEAYKGIRTKLKKEFLYCLGSHTGCGCGFYYNEDEGYDSDSIEDQKTGRKSVKQLFDYLKAIIGCNQEFEIYTCVAGKEGDPNFTTKTIDISEYKLGSRFSFIDGELIIVRKT